MNSAYCVSCLVYQQLVNDKYNEKDKIHNTQQAVQTRFTVQLTTSNREHGAEGENGG